MSSFDPAVNTGNPASQGRGAAFGPLQSQAVAGQGAPPPNPGASPMAGSPGGPMGSVAPGGFQGAFPPGQVPPQLANMLMGMNPNIPQVPNSIPGGMPGQAGGLGGGAFRGPPSGARPSIGSNPIMGGNSPGGPATPQQGAFGQMGAPTGSPRWGSGR